MISSIAVKVFKKHSFSKMMRLMKLNAREWKKKKCNKVCKRIKKENPK